MLTGIILLSTMTWITYVDLKTKTIPDTAHIILILYAIGLSITGRGLDFKSLILGLVIGAGLMVGFSLMGQMGFGDVKLMASLGTWFGMQIIDVFFLSFIVGLIFVVFYYTKHRQRKMQIPFGPSIALAACMLWFGNFTLMGF